MVEVLHLMGLPLPSLRVGTLVIGNLDIIHLKQGRLDALTLVLRDISSVVILRVLYEELIKLSLVHGLLRCMLWNFQVFALAIFLIVLDL